MTTNITNIFPDISKTPLCTSTLNKWDESRGIFLIGGKYYESHESFINEAYRVARLLDLSLVAISDTETNFILHTRTADDLFILNSLLTGKDKGEFSFTIDLPFYIVDINKFQRNFENACKDNGIKASFEMNTPYIRRLSINTNDTDSVVILKRLHAHGAFNVGLHHKEIRILPEFR